MAYRPGTAQTERVSSDTFPSSNASSPPRELMDRADEDDEYSPVPSAKSKGQNRTNGYPDADSSEGQTATNAAKGAAAAEMVT
eukprot:2072382-Pleurochrysis_carterae.AAC.1